MMDLLAFSTNEKLINIKDGTQLKIKLLMLYLIQKKLKECLRRKRYTKTEFLIVDDSKKRGIVIMK